MFFTYRRRVDIPQQLRRPLLFAQVEQGDEPAGFESIFGKDRLERDQMIPLEIGRQYVSVTVGYVYQTVFGQMALDFVSGA